MKLNATPGTLRWVDLAEAHKLNPLITSRRKVEIPDQQGLMTAMEENNHKSVSIHPKIP